MFSVIKQLSILVSCWSCRSEGLASHHFASIVELALSFDSSSPERKSQPDRKQLRDLDVRLDFASKFNAAVEASAGAQSLEEEAARVSTAFAAASEVLPKIKIVANRPWTSSETLSLIRERDICRRKGDFEREKLLNKDVRRAARTDRRHRLEEEVASGSWSSVRSLRKGNRIKHAGVRNLEGVLTGTGERAETLADYFEKVQWSVQFPGLRPSATQPIGDQLPISVQKFTIEELRRVLGKLKTGKAAGVDDIPPDFWKALLCDESACLHLLSLCQRCWEEKDLPRDWRTARVVLLFKRGDAALPENYRPISLLAVGYKVLA